PLERANSTWSPCQLYKASLACFSMCGSSSRTRNGSGISGHLGQCSVKRNVECAGRGVFPPRGCKLTALTLIHIAFGRRVRWVSRRNARVAGSTLQIHEAGPASVIIENSLTLIAFAHDVREG